MARSTARTASDEPRSDVDQLIHGLQTGTETPARCFSLVQELPQRARPRALQTLLHTLSGEQIRELLMEAAQRHLQGSKWEDLPGLNQAIIRCGPCLPGFRDICPQQLLLHPTHPAQEAGSACVLELLVAQSSTADEAVAAFFDAGSEAVRSLLKWVLKSSSSLALCEFLCESLVRLDFSNTIAPEHFADARLDDGLGSRDGCVSSCEQRQKGTRHGRRQCVIDAVAEQLHDSRWSIVEISRLAEFVASLRRASFNALGRRRETTMALGVLLDAANKCALRFPCIHSRNLSFMGCSSTCDWRVLQSNCMHEHWVESLLEGLGSVESGSSSSSFIRDLVASMSLSHVDSTLKMIEGRHARGRTADTLKHGTDDRCCYGYCRASLRAFERAAHLIMEHDEANCGSEAPGLRRVPLVQVEAALECLLHTAHRYLSISRSQTEISEHWGQKGIANVREATNSWVSVMRVSNGKAFSSACEALALLSWCNADKDSAASTRLFRRLAQFLDLHTGHEEEPASTEDEMSAPTENDDAAVYVDLAHGAGSAEPSSRSELALELAQRKGIAALVLALASLRIEDHASTALPSENDSYQRNPRSFDCVSGRSRHMALKVLLQCLTAGAWHPCREAGAPEEFVETIHVLEALFTSAGNSTTEYSPTEEAVRGLFLGGILACIPRLFDFEPRCLAHSSFLPESSAREGLVEVLLKYISSFLSDHSHQKAGYDPQASTSRWPLAKTTQGLGATLSAVQCFLAAHVLNGSLAASDLSAQATVRIHPRDRPQGSLQDRALWLWLTMCRLYSALVLDICASKEEDEKVAASVNSLGCSGKTEDRTMINTVLEMLKQHQDMTCGWTAQNFATPADSRKAGSGWQVSLMRRGMGYVGLVLTSVLRATDDAGLQWLSPVFAQHQQKEWAPKEDHDRWRLPEEVLRRAREEVLDRYRGKQLRLLIAVCRCSVMAGEVAQVMLTNLFRKGALKGGGIFLDMYHAKGVAASTSEEALVLDQATLQQDRRQAWEALFGACNHLSNMHEDMAQSLHTTCTSAVVGSIKARKGVAALAPLLQARPVRMLVHCARPSGNALMALAELIDVEAEGQGISRHPSLWPLLEQDVLAGDRQGHVTLDVLHDLLDVCKARPSDDLDSIWSGFVFVMFMLSSERCPRINAIVCSTSSSADDSQARKSEQEDADRAAILVLLTLIADFVSSWAHGCLKAAKDSPDSARLDALGFIEHLETDGCRLLLPVLVQLLRIPALAQNVHRLNGFRAVWEMMIAQPLEWLLQGGTECPLLLLLSCLLQSPESISDITTQFDLNEVKGFINRIMVQCSGSIGHAGGGLGRQRREMLCMYIERLDRFRLVA